jgi:hypothetical protein
MGTEGVNAMNRTGNQNKPKPGLCLLYLIAPKTTLRVSSNSALSHY